MKNELVLVKQEAFGNVNCEFYKQGKDVFMTRKQMGEVLEYANPADAIKDIHERNKARLDKFSRIAQIALPSGGVQKTVLYSAKGVYEICRFSKQPKANDFYDFVYDILEGLRKGETKIVEASEYDKEKLAMHMKNAEARLVKAQNERITLLASLGERLNLPPESKQAIASYCTETITGRPLIQAPQVTNGLTPTQIAEQLGTNSQVIGRIISKLGIRPTSEQGGKNEYGYTFLGQSKTGTHQPEQQRYYDKAVKLIEEEFAISKYNTRLLNV